MPTKHKILVRKEGSILEGMPNETSLQLDHAQFSSLNLFQLSQVQKPCISLKNASQTGFAVFFIASETYRICSTQSESRTEAICAYPIRSKSSHLFVESVAQPQMCVYIFMNFLSMLCAAFMFSEHSRHHTIKIIKYNNGGGNSQNRTTLLQVIKFTERNKYVFLEKPANCPSLEFHNLLKVPRRPSKDMFKNSNWQGFAQV